MCQKRSEKPYLVIQEKKRRRGGDNVMVDDTDKI